MGKMYSYLCVDGPLEDTRIDREPMLDGGMQAVLACPDGRRAIYREREYPEHSAIPGGLYFVGYVE